LINVLTPMAIGALLAYVNGANDISKSIATLVGSGVTQYSRAVLWGALWTAFGVALASSAGGAMLVTFSSGLLKSANTVPATAALAVLVGASGWVALATRTGLPVSTTHALVGSLVGVIWWVQGADAIRWNELGDKIFLPLLLSPLAALALTAGCARLLRPDPQAEVSDCLCVGSRPNTLALGNTTLTLSVSPSVTVGRVSSRTA
jgi:inorganic phosphate transporter, PiT family